MKRVVMILCVFLAIQSSAQQRDWGALMRLPNKAEINEYNHSSISRAPYLCAWFDTQKIGKFKEISVDFKADYLPSATYCSLANFYLDYSDQLTQYQRVTQDGIAGYAGLQRNDRDPSRYNGILSFWDVYCWDAKGNKTTLRAQRIWPEDKIADESFGNEGTGAHYLSDYPWEAGHWYRMLLQCGTSSQTGNTTVEQWVRDLETGEWTKLCIYDLGAPNLSFTSDMAAFLENFQEATSGEIRAMEIRNVRVRSVATDAWIDVETASISRQFDWSGSYQYGADANTIWMISTGVPNCAPNDGVKQVKVKNLESGRPF